MQQVKSILAVVNDMALFVKVENLLSRASFDVVRVPSGAGALVLLGNASYDLVILGAPLSDLGLDRFLLSFRSLGSRGGGSPILVLARADHVDTLDRALEEDLVGVVAETFSEREMHEAVSRLLGVAARTSTRILVEVKVELGPAHQRRFYQTHNLSETGLLLRGTEAPPLGSRVDVAFSLPGDETPIEAVAEVVRRADPRREGLEGFAVRLVELMPGDRERLAAFVQGRVSRGAAPGPSAEGAAAPVDS